MKTIKITTTYKAVIKELPHKYYKVTVNLIGSRKKFSAYGCDVVNTEDTALHELYEKEKYFI